MAAERKELDQELGVVKVGEAHHGPIIVLIVLGMLLDTPKIKRHAKRVGQDDTHDEELEDARVDELEGPVAEAAAVAAWLARCLICILAARAFDRVDPLRLLGRHRGRTVVFLLDAREIVDD